MQNKFNLKVRNHATKYFNLSKKRFKIPDEIDSDTTFSDDEDMNPNKPSKGVTHRKFKQLPTIKNNENSQSVKRVNNINNFNKKMLKRKPKIVDFSSNPDELNANQHDENGNLYFDLKLDSDRFVSLSPVKSRPSKLREYYDHNLW
jgi:hypothetical protein